MITIAMLAKNETFILAHTLPPLLKSGLPIVVLDTGSTDGTQAFLQERGVTVHAFKWTADFAAARNALLAKIKTPWVLFLDADDYISTRSLKKLERLVKHTDRTIFWLPVYQNTLDGFEKNVLCNFREKLFRTDQGYHYIDRIHESLAGYPPEELSIRTQIRGAAIYHWGNYQGVHDALHDRKVRNYVRIYEQIENETPPHQWRDHAYMYLQMAERYRQLSDNKKAMHYYIKSVRALREGVRKVNHYYYLCRFLLDQGRYDRVRRIVSLIEKRFGKLSKELYLIKGKTALQRREFQAAHDAFQKVLTEKTPVYDMLLESNPYDRVFQPHFYLGFIFELAHHPDEAKKHYLMARQIATIPELEEALDRVLRTAHG